MLKKINSFYRNYGNILSFIIGIAGFIFGFIQYFYPYSSRPDLKYSLKESINVVSVKQNIEALQITFNNKNIQKDSLGLKVFKIRLKNDGNSPVTQADYATIPFGLRLKNGNLVSVRHDTPNQYLKDNISPVIKDSSQVILGKCIIDAGQYVDLEILVIHKLNQTPIFSSIGKISGIDTINITTGKDKETSWLSLIIFFGGFFLSLWAFGVTMELLGKFISFLKEKNRRRILLNFYDFPINPLDDSQRTIVNIVTEIGYKSAQPIFDTIIQNQGSYSALYKTEIENKNIVTNFRQLIKNNTYKIKDVSDKDLNDYDSHALFIIQTLKESSMTDNDLRVKREFLLELIDFNKRWK